MAIRILRIVMRRNQLLAIFVTITLSLTTSAGENPTSTPAPSKTPLPTTNPTRTTEETQGNTSTPLPFTQDNLNVLSGNVQRPNGIAWHNDFLYTACNGDWTLYEINDTTGATRTFIYGIRNAHTLLVEDNNTNSIDVWVVDYDTNSLLRVNQARAPQTVATNLEGPWGITRLDDESFLITNLIGNSVSQVTESGNVALLNDQMRSPTGITTSNEFIYIANNGSARRAIEWSSKDSLENGKIEFSSLVSGLQNVTGLTVGPDGLLYFAYALGTRGVIGRVDPEVCRESGGCTNDEVELVIYSELAAPIAGLTINPEMQLFLHTIYRPEIYWVQLESVEQSE